MNATTAGIAKFGIAIYDEINKKVIMDDYDAGQNQGSKEVLDKVMIGLVGEENWVTAKKQYEDARLI